MLPVRKGHVNGTSRDNSDTGKDARTEARFPRGDVPIMTPDKKSLGALEVRFARRFHSFDGTRLPGENVRERRRGSLPYGSGRLYYVFGEEDGRGYLEYYACHRMGESHGRIDDDGTSVSLPELCSGFCFNPDIPGKKERKEAEMQREYRETLEDLLAKGLFDDEPIPGALAINSYLVLHRKDADDGDSSV